MTHALLHLVNTYGYALVVLLVMVEGVGVPVPGETALLTAAAVSARGELSIFGVVLAATVGATLGGTGGYWIGRSGGLALVERYGPRVGLSAEKLEKARRYFEKHGARTVFLGRFVALLRILANVLAGVAKMDFARFMLYNTLGAVCWSVLFGALGYFFGQNLPRLEHSLGRAGLVVLGAVVVVGVGVVLWRRRRQQTGQPSSRVEPPPPDPRAS